MISPPVYNCPPPNEDLNSENYDAWLHNVSNKKNHNITSYHHPDVNNKEFLYKDAWDGVVMTMLLRQQKPLVGILESLQTKYWSFTQQKPLKKFLLDFFNKYYFQHIYNRDIQNAIEFFKKHETYNGEYRSITLSMVSEGLLPTLEDYCGPENIRAGKICYERNLNFVAQWCMNNFSYHREEWCWNQVFKPLEIASIILPAAEIQAEKPKKLSRQEKLNERLNAMTQEQRRQYMIDLKINRKIAALKRTGKIDSEVDDILGFDLE